MYNGAIKKKKNEKRIKNSIAVFQEHQLMANTSQVKDTDICSSSASCLYQSYWPHSTWSEDLIYPKACGMLRKVNKVPLDKIRDLVPTPFCH